MEINLSRTRQEGAATLGTVFVDGRFECFSLEDVVRPDPNPATPANEAKVYGETAIPAGAYRVVVDFSPHFQRPMPRILDVPGFTGILIHAGNTPADTKGCVLVGDTITAEGGIQRGSSRPAFDRLFEKIKAARTRGEEVRITIADGFGRGAHA